MQIISQAAKHLAEIIVLANDIIEIIIMNLPEEKAETVLIMFRKRVRRVTFKVAGSEMLFQHVLRYDRVQGAIQSAR